MYFDHDVVVRMITDLQCTRIMKVSGAKQRTSELVRDAVELKSVLAQYPQIRYEPLDYHYVLLKYLAAFNGKRPVPTTLARNPRLVHPLGFQHRGEAR